MSRNHADEDRQRLSGRLRRAAQAWPADAPQGLAERLAARVAAATAASAAPIRRRPLAMPAWYWLATAAGVLLAVGALVIAFAAPPADVGTVAQVLPAHRPATDGFALTVMFSEMPLTNELQNLNADMHATADFLVDKLPAITLAQR